MDLQETTYQEELEIAIQAQNYIGWDNFLKGRIALDWGDIQMRYYNEVHDNDMPNYISAT